MLINERAGAMNIYIGGGTDAGGIIIHPDGTIEVVPGWNPEAFLELSHALNIIREAAQLKTPELAQGAIRSVMGFAQEQVGQYMKEGGVLVIG